MRHFFTKSTVEASIWCQICHSNTLWKIAGGRPMYCTACYERKEVSKPVEKEEAQQFDLFRESK